MDSMTAELLALVKRYRTETPLGHQPHMIGGQADELIARCEAMGTPWRPIATADRSIAVDMQFPGVPRMQHSYPIWARCEGGKAFEASWVHRGPAALDGYWWDWDGEDVVDPDEWMPHPLDQDGLTRG